jgi:broad specificity phosphatase PhoE
MKEGNKRELFLVRHLATRFNHNGVIMGREIDAEILEAEKKPFLTRIERFKQVYDFEDPCLITSPMRRCRQTAGLIRDKINIRDRLVVDSDFTETDMGDFSSKKGKDLRAQYGDLVDEWMYRPENFGFPGGESYEEVRMRVEQGLERIINENRDRSELFLVSHVDIVKMIIAKVLGFPFNNRRYLTVPTGSISVVGILDSEKLQLRRMNSS